MADGEWSMLKNPVTGDAPPKCIQNNPELMQEWYFGHGFKPHWDAFAGRGQFEQAGQVIGQVVGNSVGIVNFLVNGEDPYPELTIGMVVKAGDDAGAWVDRKLGTTPHKRLK
jgi:hypothetical protein